MNGGCSWSDAYACADNHASRIPLPEGIYLNRNLDYLEIHQDSLILAAAFSLAPCVSAYEFRGDTLRLRLDSTFAFPSHQQQDCRSQLSLPEMENSIWLRYVTHANCGFCLLNPNEQFFREQNFFKAYPWDSIHLSRTHKSGEMDARLYELTFFTSGLVRMQLPGSSEITIDSLNDNSGLKKELDYIHDGQFKLWQEGEASHGGELALVMYRSGELEKFTGSIIPFYYQNLRQFLRDFEQNIMLEFQ